MKRPFFMEVPATVTEEDLDRMTGLIVTMDLQPAEVHRESRSGHLSA